MSLVSYDVSSGESEDEEPDLESSPPHMKKSQTTPSHSGLNLSTLLPKPKDGSSNVSLFGAINSKSSVKIAVPELPDSDSDDEISTIKTISCKVPSEPSEEKPRSGLFAKLPAPMGGIGGKQPNRALIPHVFSKPKKDKMASAARETKNSASGKNTDEKNVHLSIKEIKAKSAQAAAKLISTARAKPSDENDDSDEETPSSFFSYVEKPPEPVLDQCTTETIEHINTCTVAPEVTDAYFIESNKSNSELGGHTSNFPLDSQTQDLTSVSADAGDQLTAEEILRLHGKKQKRGKEEITFIDIRADDALAGNKELLLKSISEEKMMNRTSHSKKKNTNAPTGLQKRKHQLSYLVHEAKKRELELKNSWAQNRATKMQTQAKYGF